MIKLVAIHKGERGTFTNKLYIKSGRPRYFKFTDGINVITGRNGSGKSVLLKIIKTLCGISDDSTHATMIEPLYIKKNFWGDNDDEDNYYTYPEYFQKKLKNLGFPEININWDGSIVHYLTPEFFDPKRLWNLLDNPMKRGGQELFGTGEILNKFLNDHSSGEGGIQLLGKLLNLTQEYPEPITNVNDVWLDADRRFHEWINSMPRDGKPTLLIDELDARLDLDNQKAYWDYIHYLTKIWQVIVVSHSYFAFKLDNVNHIPLDKLYFNKVRKL